MAIAISTRSDGAQFIISLDGRLDHYALTPFCDTYEAAPAYIEHYVVDMEKLKGIDSSGLGMLLLLQDHAGGKREHVHLVNASAQVLKVLTIANYSDLFEIN